MAKLPHKLLEYIVFSEKDVARETLNCMRKKSQKNRENFMFAKGAYFALKEVCKILHYKYPFLY